MVGWNSDGLRIWPGLERYASLPKDGPLADGGIATGDAHLTEQAEFMPRQPLAPRPYRPELGTIQLAQSLHAQIDAPTVPVERPWEARTPAADMVESLLSENRGVFIGEEHNDLRVEQFMVENMERFAERGVTVLGMEMIYSKDQHLLDGYFRDPETYEPQLKQALRDRWGGHDAFRFSIIESAREAGIRVVGIDQVRRDASGDFIPKEQVNQHWADQIEAAMDDEPPGAKFIAYGGFLHTYPEGEGVDEALNVPSVIHADVNKLPPTLYGPDTGLYVLPRRPGQNDYERAHVTSFADGARRLSRADARNDPTRSEQYATLAAQLDTFRTLRAEGAPANEIEQFARSVDPLVAELLASAPAADADYLAQVRAWLSAP